VGAGGVGNVFSFSCTHTDFGLGFHPDGISGRGNLKVIYLQDIMYTKGNHHLSTATGSAEMTKPASTVKPSRKCRLADFDA
jgi:hypothetical protein